MKIKLEKKIEQFEKALEIQNLEKFVLNQEELFRSTRENRENKTKISSYSRTKIRERIESWHRCL